MSQSVKYDKMIKYCSFLFEILGEKNSEKNADIIYRIQIYNMCKESLRLDSASVL